MSITTKKGDWGDSLSAFGLLPKDHVFFEVVGDLDEAQATIGLLNQWLDDGSFSSIKRTLHHVMIQLSTVAGDLYQVKAHRFHTLEQTDILEKEMTVIENNLPPLKGFILPVGHRAATQAHLARAIVRRAERHYVTLSRDLRFEAEALPFLNRLSDYLFLIARLINHVYAIEDTLR